MRTYRIFFASSYQLQAERTALVSEINRINDKYFKKQIHLELVIWEKLDAGNDPVRKQNFYNEQLNDCDLLILAYWGQLGIFTKEEYQLAQNLFVAKGLPKIYIFKKTAIVDFDLKPENVTNLEEIETILYKKDKEQWPWEYENAEGFIKKFSDDLQARFDSPSDTHFIFPDLPKAKLISPNGAANPNVFVGREDELKEIRKRLDNCGKLMLINAEGGIGKTTLAAKYWNESLHEYKHNAWLFCDNGIMNAIKELAPKLNLDLVDMDENQQLNALKHALSAVHDDFLLVLDNANDDEDIRIFRQNFEGFHWHVLITSRCQGVLDKEQELPITHLPPPLAKALFERYYKEDSPAFEALLDRLLEAIRYHTLLVEIFAKNMYESAELGIRMADFLQKLENEGLHLGKHSFEIKTDYTIAVIAKAATTDEILDALYDFGKLSEDQRFLLVNLAFLPAEPYTLQFINSLLANDSHRTDLDLRKTLKSLSKRGWVAHTDNTYRLSPVIQDLTIHKNKDTLGTDAQDLLNRLNYILEDDDYNLIHINLEVAGPYVKLIFQINKSLEAYPSWEIGRLNFSVGVYFGNIGNIIDECNAYTVYRTIYQKLLKIDNNNLSYKNGLAISYAKLGGIYEQTGDLKHALLNYQEYYQISKEIYESNPENLSYKNGLTFLYSKLGGIYEQTGDWKNALLNYQEYYRISKEICESSPENLSYKNAFAISHDKLGNIYKQIGDWKNALLNYQEQLRISKETYESSPENLFYKNSLAISYSKLGGIYEQKEDWKNAMLNYQEYYLISKEVYESSPENLSYKNGFAVSYEKLGGIYEQTGDWKNALLYFQKQLQIFKEIYKSNPENLSYKNGLAISYQRLGVIYEQTKDWKNALLNYQEDFKITKEIYESSPENLSYKNGLVISLAGLGSFYLKQNDLGNSLNHFLQSRTLSAELLQATQGKIVAFTYYFALNTRDVTRIIKHFIQNNQYNPERIPAIMTSIKSMRQEGYQALKPLAEQGLLQDGQKWLFTELSDETWYNF